MAVIISDNAEFSKRYRAFNYLRFWFKVFRGYLAARKRLRKTIEMKVCYYGPFKGEFGHMTAHTAPFLMYLHKKGVKIIYCGMELHKPLLVDDKKNSIIHDFRVLRDFFSEISPSSNNTIPPPDVQKIIDAFEAEALLSGFPFWNIGDEFYYWFIHRNWLLKGHTFTYNLRKAYQSEEENSVCIFPRNKGGRITKNNGERWDYQEVIDTVKPYFDRVYICGHPSQCESIRARDNVEVCVSADNTIMLEKCANSKLIITQHSGVSNIGEYTRTPVLIIYKGGSQVSDIGSIYNTLRFRQSIGMNFPLSFAFSLEQIKSFIKELRNNKL